MPLGSGFVETSAYNDLGQLELSVDFAGRQTVFTYDTLGRLDLKEFFAAGKDPDVDSADETVDYDYNNLGRLETTDDSANGLTSNTYDTEGRLTDIVSPEGTIHYVYDPTTGQKTSTYTDNTQTDYAYDDLGRLETVTVLKRNGTPLGTSEVTAYTYDLLGNLDTVTLPNEVISDYVYDQLNRLDNLTHYEPEGGSGDPNSYLDNDVLAKFDYELLLDGKRASVTETDENGDQTYIDWVYDELGRLVFEESYSAQLPARCYIDDYQYDLVGNRLTKDHDIGGDDIVDEAITYLYDANDRLLVETRDDLTVADDDGYTHYEYGPNADFTDPANRYGGDFTEQTKKIAYTGDEVTGTRTSQTDYTYNVRGRQESADVKQYDVDGVTITSQTTTGYSYNDSGIRTSQTVDDGSGAVTTEYVIDGNNITGYAQVLEEHVYGQLTKTYTIGHDLISQADATGTVHHFLYDGHGSNRALLDTSGVVVESYAYDAYGNAVDFDAANALTTILYSGEQFDVATSQQYLRARYYDATIGRFNRSDPFGGDILVPMSLHKYGYGQNSPVEFVDPSGLLVSATGTLGAVSIMTNLLSSSLFIALAAYKTQGVLESLFGQRQLRAFAQRIGADIGTQADIDIETRDRNYRYFVHGSSTSRWPGDITGIIPFRGREDLDFGQGFYTFEATPWGITSAGKRAGQITSGLSFVLLVRMDAQDYNALNKKDLRGPEKAAEYNSFVNMYRNGYNRGLTGYDLVIGKVAKRSNLTQTWIARSDFPPQFKFEGWAGVRNLEPVLIVPVTPSTYLA